MTRTLVARVELDLIGWRAPQPLHNRAISDSPRATITMQFGKKLHAFLWELMYGNSISM